MPPRRERQEQVTPTLLQYSFESCLDEHLLSCREYEYLASSELIRDAVERNRASQTDLGARAVSLLFGPDIFWTLAEGLWPRPYLELLAQRPPSTASTSRAGSKRRRLSSKYLAKLVTPWTYLRDAKEAERLVPLYVNPYLTLPLLLKAIRELLLKDYPHLLRAKGGARLEDAFMDLLQREDPEWYELERTFHKRGQGSRIEVARDDLRALSVWRLTKQFSYTAQAALELLHAHGIDAYQEVRSLRRAVRRAARKIATFEDLLHRYAVKVTA
jgi:hypothetical protein